jgi:hypothetical protein
MEEKLIKEALKQMKRERPQHGKCPDEADMCRFVEGTMDEQETEHTEKHLVSCSPCCDYVVSLNRVIHFPEEEPLPDVPAKQKEQAFQVCKLVEESGGGFKKQQESGLLEQVTAFLKDIFSFAWLMQPMPVMVKASAVALLVMLVFSSTYLYYQESVPPAVQMELMGKTRVITRGVPTGETIQKIVKEGDTLFSNDYCRINFELDKDAYAYVVYFDSKGTLHQLYPDASLAMPQKVKGKTPYTIPEGADSWFQLDNQTGRETVFILASREPIRDFNETIGTIQGLGRDEILRTLESKAPVLKVLSFNHQ